MSKVKKAIMIGLDSADATLVKRLIDMGRLPAMKLSLSPTTVSS